MNIWDVKSINVKCLQQSPSLEKIWKKIGLREIPKNFFSRNIFYDTFCKYLFLDYRFSQYLFPSSISIVKFQHHKIEKKVSIQRAKWAYLVFSQDISFFM